MTAPAVVRRATTILCALVAVAPAGCAGERASIAIPSALPRAGVTQAAVAAMPASVPVRLRIPEIGVDSPLIRLGLRDDGSMKVPPNGLRAGWYTGAPTPGELGPAVIAGHVDWAGQPGVFFRLRQLTPGDHVMVARENGTTARFLVTQVTRFPKDEFPTRAVYGDIDHAGLRLITCGGRFDRRARSYEDNLVVFARLE